MATVGKMIDDLELRLTGGKPSDDIELSREQMQKWLDDANSALLPDWIAKKNGGQVPPAIIRRIDCLAVKTDTPSCVDACCSYHYIQFPNNSDGQAIVPIALPGDGGVIQVLRGKAKIYRLPSPTMLQTMTNLENGETTPYFYRIGDKLFLFNGIYPSYCKITVMAAISDTSSLTDEDVYPTVEALIPLIMEAAEKIGQRQMQGDQDLQDDGIYKTMGGQLYKTVAAQRTN